ncbi:MmpS family transport accessory protein [Streptomyces mirabilis]|uniref:MmpS family transport accessory protein n=1 Tax=Streptomyces mirabilis TaxID=68239 RepID=UPI0036748FB0
MTQVIDVSGCRNDQKTAAAKPAPRVTVTATAAGGKAKPEPAPTVTVTKTAKPAATKAEPKKTEPAAPADKVMFKVCGSAPAGVDITYGSDSDNLQGRGLPMTKTLTLKDDAMYYNVTAQLQGGGDVHCSVTVDGKTKTGHASGGYNICNAQLSLIINLAAVSGGRVR